MTTLAVTKPLRSGDHVRIQFGYAQVEGIIQEVRGPIGAGGRNLYTVEFEFGADEPYRMDLPAEKIEKMTV